MNNITGSLPMLTRTHSLVERTRAAPHSLAAHMLHPCCSLLMMGKKFTGALALGAHQRTGLCRAVTLRPCGCRRRWCQCRQPTLKGCSARCVGRLRRCRILESGTGVIGQPQLSVWLSLSL